MDPDHIGIGDKRNHHDEAPCVSEKDAMLSNCVPFSRVDDGTSGCGDPFGEVYGGGPIDITLSAGVNYGSLTVSGKSSCR
ncbi:hypothetical protein R1flu_022875 [Riccia fluitans]|uniref:Uncharacterized protein n=1 Tax=Riccia fluitans TaxID=41844 RepID=A0ABD1XQF6_9MARC